MRPPITEPTVSTDEPPGAPCQSLVSDRPGSGTSRMILALGDQRFWAVRHFGRVLILSPKAE